MDGKISHLLCSVLMVMYGGPSAIICQGINIIIIIFIISLLLGSGTVFIMTTSSGLLQSRIRLLMIDDKIN
jgi:hypothetical protein